MEDLESYRRYLDRHQQRQQKINDFIWSTGDIEGSDVESDRNWIRGEVRNNRLYRRYGR